MSRFMLILLMLVSLGVMALTGLAQQDWQWCQRTFSGPSTTNPHARYYHAMAYDSTRKFTVLFGGYYRVGQPRYYCNDTWERDESYWVKRAPSSPIPSGRYCHAMAYDSARGVTVLFGGHSGSGYLQDTWEWNGAQWTNMTPSIGSPPARRFHAMAYDSKRGVTVLFGGEDGTRSFSDTWEWNGKTWTQRKISGPINSTGINSMAMAYDPSCGFTVLFGGVSADKTAYGTTWVYDGAQWSIRFLANGPSARHGHALAYDSIQQRTVLFGGHDGAKFLSDTYSWDGVSSSWRKLSLEPSPAKNPTARYRHAMVFDSSSLGQVVMFGGYDGSYESDSWALTPITRPNCTFAGTGHSGGGLGIECKDPQNRPSPPRIGTTIWASFVNSRSRAAGLNILVVGPLLPSPWTLAAKVVPSTGFLHVFPVLPLQQSGNPAHFPLPIPNNPALQGLALGIQGGSYEINGCYRLTDAIKVTVY